jgi:hypothetical protein
MSSCFGKSMISPASMFATARMPLMRFSTLLTLMMGLSLTTGCTAQPGEEGPAGPAGEPGEDGQPGMDGADGDPAERVVHWATFTTGHLIDSGLVPNRALTVPKAADETGLRVTYFDHHGAQSGTGNPPCACFWEVLFDGERCASPGPLEGLVASIVEQTLVSQTISGYCYETEAGPIASGDAELTVEVSHTEMCSCDSGLSGVLGFIEAEELQ